MPPPNLRSDFEEQARQFVDSVIDQASAAEAATNEVSETAAPPPRA